MHPPVNHSNIDDNRSITDDTCIPGQLGEGNVWMDRCVSLWMILYSRSFVRSFFVYPMLCWSALISSAGLLTNNSSSVAVNPEFLPGYGVPPVPPTPPRPLPFFLLLLSCPLHVAPLNSVQYRLRTTCIRDTVQCRYPRRNSMRISFHRAARYLVSQCGFRIASRSAGWRWLLRDFWLGD